LFDFLSELLEYDTKGKLTDVAYETPGEEFLKEELKPLLGQGFDARRKCQVYWWTLQY
jgi:hypothetical protein